MNREYLYFYQKICASNLPSSSVAVYKALLQYANRKTWSCFPSINTLARDTKLSQSTIRRHLRLLENEGYILKVSRKRDNKGNTSNMYFLN